MDYRLYRQSTGWLYLILIPLIHFVYRLLFRKIYLHNREGVAPHKPVLIAANHPTAFIDPIFFCLFFDPPVYNMTRGDIFRKPFFRKLLMSCNMFPVFRQKDGYQGRDRNDEVFEFCQQKLHDRVTVNIFVEGEHHLDKRVLATKKGIARIAFGTYERHRMDDLQIVPVGCNYVSGERARDEAKIIVGDPIFVRDYWAQYEASPGAAVNQLCRDINTALKKICYHIEDPQDDALAEQLLTLWRNTHSADRLPIVEVEAPRFFAEKALLDALNALPYTEKEALRQKTTQYFSALKAAGLDDEALNHPEHGAWEWLLFLIPTAPLALFGFMLGYPVRGLVYWLTHRLIKKREFYTSIIMGLGVLLGGIYFFTLLLTGIFTDRPLLVSLAMLMPLFAWLAIYWKEHALRWLAARKVRFHPEKVQLKAQRAELQKMMPT